MIFEENAKKYKRILESIDITEYSIEFNHCFYKVVAYYRFGITKGNLVLYEDGKLCSRDEAVNPYKMFMIFNSYMQGFSIEGSEEINKPTWVFQETIKILDQIQANIINTQEEVAHAIGVLNELDSGSNKLKDIHTEAMETYDEMYSKGVLNSSVVDHISNLMRRFTNIQYKNLNLQINLKKIYLAIVNELHAEKPHANGEDKKRIKKAEELFQFLIENKYQEQLKKSLINFETDVNGQQLSLYSQPDWECKLGVFSFDKNEHEFKTNVLPMLRN
jgi:hypothetical protein